MSSLKKNKKNPRYMNEYTNTACNESTCLKTSALWKFSSVIPTRFSSANTSSHCQTLCDLIHTPFQTFRKQDFLYRYRCIFLDCTADKCLFNDRSFEVMLPGALNSEVKAQTIISSSLLQVMQVRARKQVNLASSSDCSSLHDWCGK